MIGILEWGRGTRPERVQIAGLRCVRVRVKRGGALLRQRCARAVRTLARQGARRLILPEDFPDPTLPERYALGTVDTLPLRRALAAEWAAWALGGQGGTAARVAVSAEDLTPAVVRTVTELALRCRYVLLETPYGGEELCRTLRREYGVSLLLNPGREALESAEVWVSFDRRPPGEHPRGVLLPLCDETAPLPPLLLSPALEEQLPEAARPKLLSVLLEAGLLRPGEVSFRRAVASTP